MFGNSRDDLSDFRGTNPPCYIFSVQQNVEEAAIAFGSRTNLDGGGSCEIGQVLSIRGIDTVADRELLTLYLQSDALGLLAVDRHILPTSAGISATLDDEGLTVDARLIADPDGLTPIPRAFDLASRMPSGTLAYVEVHDLGTTLGDAPSDDDTDELPQTSRGGPRPGYDPTLFLYEHVPGGTGLSERIHQNRKTLLFRAERLIAGCPCDLGCPACVGPSDQGPRKSTALFLLGAMLAAVVDEG